MCLELSVQFCLLTGRAAVLSEMLITSPRSCLLTAGEFLLFRKYRSLCHRVIVLKIVTSDTTLKEFKCGMLLMNNTTVRISNMADVDYNYGLEEEEIKEH